MNKIKVTILGSIIATSLLLSGCNSEPEVYSVKISQVDKMKVSEIAQKMNADEMFAVYYIKMSSKEDINDKTVSEVVKMFEKETKTKVVKGEIKDFKEYKVRDMEIQTAAAMVNKQATKEQITHMRKYIQSTLQNGTPEQKKELSNMTLGELLKK